MKELKIAEFIDSLQYMGKGMLGILIVTVIIIAAVMLINALGNGVSNNNQQQ